MENSVDNIINVPFKKRSQEDQLGIIKRGKPRPPLPNLICIHKDKKGEYTRRFSLSQYDLVEWMTGCDIRSKLFCWPCLLFSTETGVWNEQGYTDLNHLTSAQKKHEKSQSHIQSLFTYTMLEKKNGIHNNNENQTFHEVNINRGNLRRIIDAICFLSKDICCNIVEDTKEETRKVNMEVGDNYLEFFNVLRNYDPFLDIQLNNKTSFYKTFSTFRNDIIKGISFLVKNHIKEEIRSASFVSLILVKTRDVQPTSQFSTVLRFVQDGKIRERFIGIVFLDNHNVSDDLVKYIAGVVEEFQIGDKLCGLTYNGAGKHINDIQSRVLNNHPYAILTPCYADQLNYDLQQDLSTIKECNVFFKVLNSLRAYFSKSQKRINILNEFINRTQQTIKWNSLYSLCNTLREHRNQFTEFFDSLLANCEKWDDDSIVKANGFLTFLREFKTIVLLEMFSKLFECTEILQNAIQNRPYEMQYCYMKITNVLKQLYFDKNRFEEIWSTVLNNKNDGEEILPKRIKLESEDEEKQVFNRLYNKIIDYMCLEIETRYSSLLKLEYFLLLHPQNYEEFESKFPDNLLGVLKSYHGFTFDYIRLKNELSVLYSNLDFANKYLPELLEFINNNNLMTCFKEVYKLGELILTMPISVPPEETFSALQKIKVRHGCYEIKNRLHDNRLHDNRLHDYHILSIERDLLTKLKEDENFYNKVIQQLPNQNDLII